MTLKKIRILISSPGDVQEERDIARGVIQQLGRSFAGRLQLQPLLWEELALGADMSFQEGIDIVLSEQGVDVAVFILWSRLGSPTGPLMTGSEGRTFRSGTEREWYLMLQSRQDCARRGITPRPNILVYTRQDDVSFHERLRGKTDEHRALDLEQKLAVSQFVKEEFHDAQSGVNIRAYHNFEQPTTFAKQLRTHLTNLLESLHGVELERPYWNVAEKGPPFRGLDVFEFEHSPIFFGREDELVAIRNRLREQACRGCAFLLISGASGSGKSSLARAGVIPDIVTHELDANITSWRHLAIKPNQLGENLLAGLVSSLLGQEVLPELAHWNEDLAVPGETSRIKEWTARFLLRVKDAVKSCSSKRGSTRLLILIDQMEELFSSTTQTPESIQHFFDLLEDLSRTGLVWVVATVRSDFYHECQKVPALVRMKDGSGQFDLLPPTSDSLMRVVTGPAHLAGLRFEKDGEKSLADSIIGESARCAELLPLVEYLLLDLYEHRTSEGVLTFSRFRELGGLEGALRHRCEETFAKLPARVQAALPSVLSKLVTLSGDDLNTAVRRVVPWSRIAENEGELEFVEAMVAQRLFTTYSDSAGTKVVNVTHEAVLRIWPKVSEWTDRNREFLRVRSRIEQSMARWKQQPDPSLLLAEGVPLKEGGELLREAAHLLDADAIDYIKRSIAFHELQRRRRRQVLVVGSILAAFLMVSVGWYGWRVRNQAQADGIVSAILAANPVELERLIEKELPAHRGYADPLLRKTSEENPAPEEKKGLHARLALLPVENRAAESLQRAIVTVKEPEYLALIVRALRAKESSFDLWPQFRDSTLDAEQRFRAGLALATLQPQSPQWTKADADFLTERLVRSNPIYQSTYFELLKPLSVKLIEPLRVVFTSPESTQVEQLSSANAIASFVGSDSASLTEFLAVANAEQYNILYPVLEVSSSAKEALLRQAKSQPAADSLQAARIDLGIRRAGAAITLLRVGERASIFDVFRVTEDPESLSQFVARCKDRGVTIAQLLECLDLCEQNRQKVTGNERMMEDRVLYGLMLALGDYSIDLVPPGDRDALKKRLATWYASDPSSTVHGASGWLLRRWGYEAEVTQVDRTTIQYDPTGKRDWFTLEIKVKPKLAEGESADEAKAPAQQSLYFTFIVFPAGEYLLGSPEDQASRQADEAIRKVTLSRPFAVCDRELTWEQFDLSDSGEWRSGMREQFGKELPGVNPVFGQNWYDSVSYCRWLTSQRGMKEVDQCYENPEDLDRDEQGNPKYSRIDLSRCGFRLPTEAEWEVMGRSGVRSAYSFGSDARLLKGYGWFLDSSQEWSHRTAELKPNLRGLYDVEGNLFEWCHDWYTSELEDGSKDPIGAGRGSDRVIRGGSWNDSAANCRAAVRNAISPSNRGSNFGFRLVLSPSTETETETKAEAEPLGGGTEGASAEQRP